LNNRSGQKTNKHRRKRPCCDADYFLGIALTEFSSANCDEFKRKKENKNKQQG
jgi:hypothetical protein